MATKTHTKPETKLQGEAQDWGARVVSNSIDIDTLTPRTYKNLLLEAEGGNISAQAALFERMEEKDGELDGHLRTRKAGVASVGWQIEAADDSPDAERAAEYCRDAVAEISNIEDAIFDLLDAIPKGFAAQEIEWKHSASTWAPLRLIYRPQRWFQLGGDGRTLLLRGQDWEGVALNPLNWILHRVRARSGFDSRTPLLRSLTRAFIVRHFSWKDWMAFAEVYGMPPRIGRLREGVPWDSKEAQQLWSAVQALGMDAAAVVREGDTIEFADTKSAGEGKIFESILDRAGREMTLAILGQLLTSGGEGGGSYALGKVHNQVRWDLLETDARALGATLKAQLLRPLVLLNLGDKPVPNWAFIVEEPEDLSQLATTIKTLGEAGLRVPAKWAYDKFGIPEPAGDEEVLVPSVGGGFGMANTASLNHEDTKTRRRNQRAIPGRDLTDNAILCAVARDLSMEADGLMAWICQEAADWRLIDDEALAWLAEKRVATQAAWEQLGPAGRQRAWWVTGLNEQQTARVANELMAVLQGGETENQFLERLENLGVSVPGAVEPVAGQIPAWQARLVHRNNRFTANNAGQYIRIQRDRSIRPYGQWLCHSPCPICEPLCGHAAPLDGDFFSRYWPQMHHGCQCEVVSLSQEEVDAEGIEIRGEYPDPIDAPPDWLYHPGDAFYLEAEGGGPVTDAGRSDLQILSRLALPEGLL